MSTRRQFLRAAGTTLALPPLFSLMPDSAVAQMTAGRKNRSLVWVGAYGIDPHQFFPPNQSDLASVQGEDSVMHKKLQSFGSTKISRVIDTEFAALYPKMNVMQGLSLTGGNYLGHNISILTGTHSGERDPRYGKSIDVIMEKSPGVYRSTDRFVRKAVRLYNADDINVFSFDRVDGKRITSDMIQGDLALFNTLFSGSLGGSTGNSSATRAHDKLIVDRVHAELKALEKNPRLSREDRTVLDHYINGVFELQQKVQAPGMAVECKKPTPTFQVTGKGNAFKFPNDPAWGIKDRGKMFDNIDEMIKLAFACDLTRVVYIGNTIFGDSPSTPSGGGLHHTCPSSEEAADRQRWGVKRLLSLAKALDSAQDPFGGGTLLDNSILLYINELGAWLETHNIMNLPILTFGSGGGRFKTGFFLDYRQKPLKNVKGYPAGRPMKQLLQSIMSSMGVPRDEYMKYGDGNGFGEFKAGITQFNYGDPEVFSRYAKEHNEPLPFFSNFT
jgi:hypothetical protein